MQIKRKMNTVIRRQDAGELEEMWNLKFQTKALKVC